MPNPRRAAKHSQDETKVFQRRVEQRNERRWLKAIWVSGLRGASGLCYTEACLILPLLWND